MTGEPRFNLIDEHWIPVRLLDGSATTVGIRDALLRAHEICEIETDGPTLWPPIIRVLLAALHRAVDGPQSLEDWAELFNAHSLPVDRITAYCNRWRHRFELFDAQAPFMQCADLNHATGPKAIASLIATRPSGNNVPMFQPVMEREPFGLPFAEAAMWLLHTHAWDVAGLKGAAIGDTQALAGKTAGNRVGTLGNYGVVVATGADLKQTLLLNLVSRDLPDVIATSTGDLPVWEQDPLDVEWRDREPCGPLDLYTWNSRRIRLVRDNETGLSVVGVVIAAGDRMSLNAPFRRDPHTGFRRSSAAEKKSGSAPIYFPLPHSPERAVWRGLSSLLALHAAGAAASRGSDAPPRVAAGVLAFIGSLRNNGLLPPNFLVRVRTVGTAYGAQNSTVAEQFGDHLDLLAAALDASDDRLRTALQEAAAAADDVGRALAHLVTDALKAAGESDNDRSTAEAEATVAAFYADLDHHFRVVVAVSDTERVDGAMAQWHRILRATAAERARQVIADAPSSALRGRDGTSLARAVNYFESSLRRCTPRAAPTISIGGETSA